MNYRQALEAFLPYLRNRVAWSPAVDRATTVLLGRRNSRRLELDAAALRTRRGGIRARVPGLLPSELRRQTLAA